MVESLDITNESGKMVMSRILHFKEMNLTNHHITVTEFLDGVLTVSIHPINESNHDSSVIYHDKNDRVLRVSSMRKVEVI